MGAARRDPPRAVARCIALRRILAFAVAGAFFSMHGSTLAQPTVTISPPVTKGQQTAPPVPSTATDPNTAKRLEEDRVFRVNRVIVEGFRDDRPARLQILEQRFTTSLNRGSPELVAGKMYDGCYYDGSYFSCADPLSSALRNLRHAIR